MVNRGCGWQGVIDFPLDGRLAKPRDVGLTMIIDKGLGLTETRELLQLAADHIDFIKLGFGTSALYAAELLRQKILLVRGFGVHIFPGGTFLEVALFQNKLQLFLETAAELGYTAVEVSDGTIDLTATERRKAIEMAREMGFKVISEVGKKHPDDRVSTGEILRQIEADLAAGAYKVIIEGRESGQGVVIYDAHGHLITQELAALTEGLSRPQDIMWEAPLKAQQEQLILRFGSNVNLGNIQPGDILALEALRVGLRGDTFRARLRRGVEASGG